MKLAHQLVIVLTACIIVILSIAGALLVRREDSLIERDLREDLLVMGRSLRPALAHTWKTEGRAAVVDLFDYTGARTERFDRVRVRWVELDAPRDSPQGLDAPPEVKAALETNQAATAHSDADGGRLMVWVPVQVEGLPRGALELRRTLADERVFLSQSVRNVVLITLILSLVLGAVVLVSGRWLIGLPVERLAAHARRIAGGDLTTPVTLHRPSDLARVGEALNEMGAQLNVALQKMNAEHSARIAALEQLRHVDRLATVGKLAAGIAHELGTPLTVVAGRGKMIAQHDALPESERENARIICSQASRMARLVRQLLDFSRQQVGPKVRSDLQTLARQCLKLLAPMAERRGITVEFQPAVPVADVEVVETQVSQALTNLLVNSVQATPEGGHLVVGVTHERAVPPDQPTAAEGDYFCVTVMDDGAGIAPSDLPHVFDPFFTTKPVGEGTGLGLSVAYGIVHEHGGWIDVSSELGQGSRFSIHLPAS